MATRVFINATAVSVLLLLVGSNSSLLAGQTADDWLRGAGNDLHLRLKGEVLEADGQPATNARITGRMNAPTLLPALVPTVDAHRFEVSIPVNQSRWYSMWLKAASASGDRVAFKKLNAYELRQAAIEGIKLTLRPPTRWIEVKVTDDDQPVSGAVVKAELGFGIELRSHSDSGGIARFGLLPEQQLSRLTAWTDDFRVGGFSFGRKPARDPDADEHVVELHGCRDQKLRFVDENLTFARY